MGRTTAAGATLEDDALCDEVVRHCESLRATSASIRGRAHTVAQITDNPNNRRDFVEALRTALDYLEEPGVVSGQARQLVELSLPDGAIGDIIDAAKAAKSSR